MARRRKSTSSQESAPAAGADAGPPADHDTQRTSPLIGPGGKVNKAALYRKAHGLPLPESGMPGAQLGSAGVVAGPVPAHARPTASAALPDAPPGAEPDAAADDDDELLPVPAAPASGAAAHAPPGEPAARVLEADDSDAPLADPTNTGAVASALKVVFQLKKDLDKRLDRYLVDRITFLSRSKLQGLIDGGAVTVNARGCKSSTRLRRGDRVEVLIPPPPSEHVPPQDIPLCVLHEDEHLIVLNKSPDIIVHPARSFLSGTMINALAYHFRHRSASGGSLSGVGQQFARPGVVHRLDRQTSGCIVFAKTEAAHWGLARQFMDRTVEKRYLAFVHGRVEPGADVIDLPIGPHPSRERGYREKHVVRHDHLGRPAVTIYRVLAGAGTAASGFSVVEVELKTGRTHQIRVHLSHRGWPLVADDMYGGRVLKPAILGAAAAEPSGGLSRVGLHAALLAFRHPATHAPMEFRAPLPADLRGFLAELAGGARGVWQAPETPPQGSVLRVAELLGRPTSPAGAGASPAAPAGETGEPRQELVQSPLAPPRRPRRP